MGILQKQIHSDFTVVHNAFIRDTRLSSAARGLLLTMLSLPDSWNFSIKGLARILPEGEKAISSTLNKLSELGYFRRERITGSDGRVIDWAYNFSDEPIFLDSPQPTEPHLQNADVVTRDVAAADVADCGVNQINKNKINNNQILNNQSLDQSNAAPENFGETCSTPSIDRIDRLTCIEKQEYDYYLEIVKQNVDYEGLIKLWELSQFGSESIKILNDVVTLMTDVICSKYPTYRIKGQLVSQELVKQRFLSLRENDVCSVVETVLDNETEIGNMQGYLTSVLYNAPTTSSANYYSGR